MKRITKKSKPKGTTWKSARLFDADLYINRLPICGGRMIWAVVGWKRVRCCEAFSNIKFSMTRKEWDSISAKERA